MKPVTYITSFRNLTLTESIDGHIELIPGVNISNDPLVKERFLTPEFARAAGAIEATHLDEESHIIFGEFDTEDLRDLPPEGLLLVILAWIDMLLKNAWLIKDHAMECDAAFLRVRWTPGSAGPRIFWQYAQVSRMVIPIRALTCRYRS